MPPLFAYAFATIIIGAILFIFWKQQSEKKTGEAATGLTLDLTALAKNGHLEPVIGMDDVVERLLHIIARKSKNNPLLLGQPGVGKTAAVEGLAQRIARGDVPEAFLNKRVLSLDVNGLLAGTKFRGELESRLRDLLRNLESNSRQTILFIDEIHTIEQTRGSEGAVDIADILKPALSRGDLQVIGATTWREYEKYIKPDAAIDRRFQTVLVHEPSRDTAIDILRGVRHRYEDFHRVCIPDETLIAAVDLSLKIKGRQLPDKAFDLIDEASAKVSIEGPARHSCALGLVHTAALRARGACKDGIPEVSVEDVRTIAEEWQQERRDFQT